MSDYYRNKRCKKLGIKFMVVAFILLLFTCFGFAISYNNFGFSEDNLLIITLLAGVVVFSGVLSAVLGFLGLILYYDT